MNRRTTITTLTALKTKGEKIAMLTSYDASFTQVAEQAGVDALLVGDSLGMVIQGHQNTLPVTVNDMVYHTANVSRASQRALIIADMPFMSYATPEQALDTARRLMQAGGAQMVKLEGDATQIATAQFLAERGVPVCGHLGLLPQAIHQLGGYRVQGRQPEAAERLLQAAEQLEQAGAQLLVLECIPSQLAAQVSRQLNIPVIGIGAGAETDGQVLVLYDILGISINRVPRFAHNFLADQGDIAAAIQAYVTAVKDKTFPDTTHSFV